MPRVPLRWFRFSLRAFLLAITLLAVWFAVQVNRANKQRRAVEAVAEYGYVVYEHELVAAIALPGGYGGGTASKRVDYGREPPGPRWLRRILGDDYFRRVVQVGIAANADVLEQITNLPDIKELSLDAYELRDEDLANLAVLPGLKSLTIMGAPQLTDEGLKRLLKCELSELRIANAPISDDAADTLAKLEGLQQLSLRHTGMTEQGLARLRKLLPNTVIPRSHGAGYVAPRPPMKQSGRFAPNHSVR